MEVGKLPGLANKLLDTGDVAGAQAMLLEGLQKDPYNAGLWAEVGSFLYQLGNFDEAIAAFERSGHLGGRDVRTAFYLGAAAYALGRFAVAEAHLRDAAGLDDRYGDVWQYLGLALEGQGRFAEALTMLDRARTRLDDPSGMQDRSWRLKFLAGDYDCAWRECAAATPSDIDARWQATHGTAHVLWRGEALRGREIVVFSHGGFGDVINFFRFVAGLIDEQPSDITILVPRCLHRLILESPILEDARNIVHVLGDDEPPQKTDGYFIWFEGLAAHFKAKPGRSRSQCVYFRADEDRCSVWAAHLGPRSGLRIGLVWRGSPAMPEDRWRSVALEDFLPFFEIEHCQWVALQGSPLTIEEQSLLKRHSVQDLSAHLVDFAETAAIMACLDLIISVDSAPAHLAGALGSRIWLLNRATSEWRWGWQQTESFWYPRMRIFNQETLGFWPDTLAAVGNAIRQEIATLSA